MQFIDLEATDDGAAYAIGDQGTEDDHQREEDQRHDAGRSRRVPEIGRGERDHALNFSSGQPPTKSTRTVAANETRGPASLGNVVSRLFTPEQRRGGKGVGEDAVDWR